MATRKVGIAYVTLRFDRVSDSGRWVYEGEVEVPDSIITIGKGGIGVHNPLVWPFEIESGVGGVPDGKGGKHAPESPEAYDAMAQSAVSFGASLSEEDEGKPDAIRRAAAIEEATGWALNDDGTYKTERVKPA